MLSSFNNRKRKIISSATPRLDENYDLRGLNLITPDQVMPKGESPYTINSRMFARDDEDTRVAIRTRKGMINHSTPVGSTQGAVNTGTVTGDASFTPASWIAIPFTASSSGLLTQVDLWVKRLDGAAGPVIVEIHADNSGAPGDLLAQSSVNLSQVTLSYQWLPAYLIDAPAVVNATSYWIVVHTQTEGLGTYHLGSTSASGGLQSANSGGTWSSGPLARFRTYVSTNAILKGFTRRDPQNLQKRTLIAYGTDIYAIPDNPATPTSISSDIHASSTRVRFEQIDDKTIWADGQNPARWWDGTTVSIIGGMTGTPTHVIAHKNRLFWIKKEEPTRVDFSGLYSFESYRGVDFFYVPNPKSPDHLTGWCVFQDNLVLFTGSTKYILSGNDISSFTMKQAVGTKGAISQEVIAVDRNYIYFMSDDKQLYRFNGVSDELLSDKMQPEFNAIQNLNDVRVAIHDNQVRVYYSRTPSVEINRMALFDLVFGQWFLDTEKPVKGAMSFKIGTNTELVEFSSRAGWAFLGNHGLSDLGKAIDFKYWTPYKAYTSGAAKDRIKRFRPILRASDSRYSMLVGRDIDFQNKPDMREYLVAGEGATWGSGVTWGANSSNPTVWGSTKLIDRASPMSGRGKHTQYRFEKKGVDTPIELYGYIAAYKSGRPR
ncbi:hypothetical protein EKK58_09555 [Candidatus Dependentiae bacterium]|nr:MAG: hypothetical protein EKK58_09555 [Candidatus Dependentiae bacterium]